MTRVLVDTSALVAFLDADDPRHADVVAMFAELASDDLVTHGYVVAESLAVTRRRLGVQATISLLVGLHRQWRAGGAGARWLRSASPRSVVIARSYDGVPSPRRQLDD